MTLRESLRLVDVGDSIRCVRALQRRSGVGIIRERRHRHVLRDGNRQQETNAMRLESVRDEAALIRCDSDLRALENRTGRERHGDASLRNADRRHQATR